MPMMCGVLFSTFHFQLSCASLPYCRIIQLSHWLFSYLCKHKKYLYTGTKLQKKVENGTQQNDKSFDYVGNFVYDLNGSLKYILFDEGRINVQTDGSYQYEYFLKDHLGNTRATFTVINNAAVEQQENAYYPFGMSISELAYNANTSTTNVVNKY
jgi:hypothetical protein